MWLSVRPSRLGAGMSAAPARMRSGRPPRGPSDKLDDAILVGKATALARCHELAAKCPDCVEAEYLLFGAFCEQHYEMLATFEEEGIAKAQDALRVPEELARDKARWEQLTARDTGDPDFELVLRGMLDDSSPANLAAVARHKARLAAEGQAAAAVGPYMAGSSLDGPFP